MLREVCNTEWSFRKSFRGMFGGCEESPEWSRARLKHTGVCMVSRLACPLSSLRVFVP